MVINVSDWSIATWGLVNITIEYSNSCFFGQISKEGRLYQQTFNRAWDAFFVNDMRVPLGGTELLMPE